MCARVRFFGVMEGCAAGQPLRVCASAQIQGASLLVFVPKVGDVYAWLCQGGCVKGGIGAVEGAGVREQGQGGFK